MAQYQAFSVTQGSDSFGAKYQASVVVASSGSVLELIAIQPVHMSTMLNRIPG